MNLPFREDYSELSWNDLRCDSLAAKDILKLRGDISIATPGLGLGDNFQCSAAIRTLSELYTAKVTINCYHPYLFENNPRCEVGTNMGGDNIWLNTWPSTRLPNKGIQPDGTPVCSARAYDILLGGYDHPLNTDSEFYPTTDEMIWGTEVNKYKPYITIQSSPDPPRKFYNISPNLERSDSSGRWMVSTDWYHDRWVDLVGRVNRLGYNVLQIGCEYEDLVTGCIDMRSVGVRKTFVVIGLADLHIGFDSFPQHVANSMGTNTIILLAGRSNYHQHTNTTYIDMSKGLECSNCRQRDMHIDKFCTRVCMDMITTDIVYNTVVGVLNE